MIEISAAQLKVFSTVCSNLVVAWLAAIIGTTNIYILTFDIVFAIFCWQLAVMAEAKLEEL